MTEHEIKAADAIIKDGSMYGVTILQIFAQNLKTVPDIDYIIRLVAVKIKQTSNFRAKSENGGFFISQE